MGRFNFCDEKRHKQRIVDKFHDTIKSKPLIVLDIPNDYSYMDEELIESIKVAVSPHLE